MRKFEKISFKQFKKDVFDDKDFYNDYSLPKRKTRYSAGYDIYSLIDYVLKPGEIKLFATGFKYISPIDEMFMIVVRSSMGFKYNIRLVNQVGIIESDYYNNESNEGHVMIKLQNEGDKDFVINKGDAIAQGIFVKFYTIDNEEEIKDIRKGGFGSTNR
jgi:dUTP pyrophosphatase